MGGGRSPAYNVTQRINAMNKIYEGIDALIGNTPLIRLARTEAAISAEAMLLAKLESFNPAGSAKDRVAMAILNRLQTDGCLTPGSVIIEPTSGNTGIGLAALAAARGYRAIIVMPDSMSRERQALMRAYGAELVLTPGKDGMAGAIARAEEINRTTPGSHIAGQFVNPENPRAHELTTGPEIWDAAEGKIDVFVAGVGTGGTLSGVGRFLKSKNPKIKIVAVEPAESPVISGGNAAPHAIQGIGAGFIPENLDTSVIDEIITVSAEDARAASRELARAEGLLAGISSGAALCAAKQIAARDGMRGKTVVTLFPDSGERYLSSGLFD
jgi:cysteine synthase A